MLSFLQLKAIVNGQSIYPLLNTRPVVIPVSENNPRVVISDGYHMTKPLKLLYKDIPVYCFRVECAVTDVQLAIGFLVLAVLYLGGMFSGMIVLKVLSFLPLIYLLIFYYTNRRHFIKLVPVMN